MRRITSGLNDRRSLVVVLGVTAALFAGTFLASLTPVADGDIFWHLAAGREMVQRRAWLRADPFTLSAAGRPWVDAHWLFQLVAYAVFEAAGLAGLVLAKAVAVGAGAIVLAFTVARSARAREDADAGAADPRAPVDAITSAPPACASVLALLAPALIGALFLARHLILTRPVVVTLLMLALFFAALEGLRRGGRRALYALPVLQIVWTNCQGLAALGPALIATYLTAALVSRAVGGSTPSVSWPFPSERNLPLRPLVAVLALCAGATLMTPYGLGAVVLPARQLARLVPTTGNLFSTAIAENVPPFVLERTAPELAAHFKWYLCGLAVCLALARGRLYLSHLLILVAFCALALMANRNVLLFYWMATPIAVLAIAPPLWRLLTLRRVTSRVPVKTGLAIVYSLVLCAVLGLAASAAIREPRIAEPTPFHFPTESARRLAQMRATGPIFAPDHCGGYLSFHVPALRPYMDTRLILHTGDEYAAFLAAVDSPAAFDALAAGYAFRWVVLTTGYPDRYLGLVQHLAASPEWRLVLTDGSEVLFAREGEALRLGDPANTETTLARLAERFAGRPVEHAAARLNLARLLIVTGETREGLRVLSTLGTRAAVQLRARAHLVAGDTKAAEALARTLLLDDARDSKSLTLLAQIEILRGQTEASVVWLRRALQVDPYDQEALRLLDGLALSDASVRGAR